MNLKTMKKEDLELLDYMDLTELILKEKNKPMNTPAIFRKICDLLELSDNEYTSKIGAFYTSLTLDKRFLLLDSAEWDLKDRHAVEVVVADEDDEEIEEEIDETDEVVEEPADEAEEALDSIHEDELDDSDDLDDLVVMTEEELEEGN